MIIYEFGTWGIGFVYKVQGSVFPKALTIAGPAAIMAAALHAVIRKWMAENNVEVQMEGGMKVWNGYTYILGFLLVFRTQIAYSRFWEGGTLLQQVRGVWFNAASNLIAFCSHDPKMKDAVEAFQHLLVRLMSVLHCTALQQVAVMEDENFEILDLTGVDLQSLGHLACTPDKLEVIMQWIQRLVIDSQSSGILPVAPPILSRVFQELSNGIVDVQSARKITEFPFPFPYAQMITAMLVLHWLLTVVITAILVEHEATAAVFAFCSEFAYWGLNYIAAEIEMPFGDDPNDLPIENLQTNFNHSLRTLVHPLTQKPPKFRFDKETHLRMRAKGGTGIFRAQDGKDSKRVSGEARPVWAFAAWGNVEEGERVQPSPRGSVLDFAAVVESQPQRSPSSTPHPGENGVDTLCPVKEPPPPAAALTQETPPPAAPPCGPKEGRPMSIVPEASKSVSAPEMDIKQPNDMVPTPSFASKSVSAPEMDIKQPNDMVPTPSFGPSSPKSPLQLHDLEMALIEPIQDPVRYTSGKLDSLLAVLTVALQEQQKRLEEEMLGRKAALATLNKDVQSLLIGRPAHVPRNLSSTSNGSVVSFGPQSFGPQLYRPCPNPPWLSSSRPDFPPAFDECPQMPDQAVCPTPRKPRFQGPGRTPLSSAPGQASPGWPDGGGNSSPRRLPHPLDSLAEESTKRATKVEALTPPILTEGRAADPLTESPMCDGPDNWRDRQREDAQHSVAPSGTSDVS